MGFFRKLNEYLTRIEALVAELRAIVDDLKKLKEM